LISLKNPIAYMAAPPSCQLGVHERLVALRIFDVLTHINVQLGLIQVYNCGASAISVPTRPRASEFQFAPALPVSSSAIPSGRNDDRTAAIEPPRAGARDRGILLISHQ